MAQAKESRIASHRELKQATKNHLPPPLISPPTPHKMSAPDQDQSQPSQSIKESSSQIQSQDHAVQHQPETESHPGAGVSSTSTTTPAPGATSATTAQSLQQPQEPSQQAQETQPQQPPASPPLPQKHTPATPGPRAGRFIQLYDGALASTLRKVNYDNFASCFPTVAAHAPNTLRNVQKQMVDYLEERCNKDFQSILADRDVIRKLNELENLVSDADRRRQEGGSDVEEPIPYVTLFLPFSSPSLPSRASILCNTRDTQNQTPKD
ncbi:mind kinetochore complex component [Colletotrichum scovillei]|uniref:Mind kinetochore complex component n=1 Tax=Colletotrichum scovillei TaxID=1209932 RepID=A0A9P7UE28_9PEZI|nr:mind kinetochore complex component [Colletotrichum scovillei]KAG7078984.1 mind kinetochore complex component [Colletotrichum scovillei]